MGSWGIGTNSPYQYRFNQHVEPLDRAGGQGGVDLHPGEPPVDFLTLMEMGAWVVCKKDLSGKTKSSLSEAISPEGPGRGVPMEEMPTENSAL